MKKTLMNVKVTIVTNDEDVSAGRKVMNGAMSMSRDIPNFAFVLYCEATDAMNKIIFK